MYLIIFLICFSIYFNLLTNKTQENSHLILIKKFACVFIFFCLGKIHVYICIPIIFLFWDHTQGLIHTRQAHYQLSYTSSPILLLKIYMLDSKGQLLNCSIFPTHTLQYEKSN